MDRLKVNATTRKMLDALDFEGLWAGVEVASIEFEERAENLVVSKANYEATKRVHSETADEVTDRAIIAAHKDNEKVSQAALDRCVKVALAHNAKLKSTEAALASARAELDQASSDFDVAKINHRTVCARINLATAVLNLSAESKRSRAQVYAALGEM